ncbi:hypothetical protein EV421DRAFT_1742360 [Armillaria borealis]|uniref:Uncharacterized protein n=1 Tax=Armillaria borealis TaxID=47425 RepID=A0AA39MFJ2_9AGAR|nr:hypothetical protein EV421DRAFT_1742360 [Armillaria borealis]
MSCILAIDVPADQYPLPPSRLLVSVGGDTSDTAARHGTHLTTGLTVLGSFLVISVIIVAICTTLARRQRRLSQQQQRRSSTNSFAWIMDLFPTPPPLQEPPTTFVFPHMNGKLDKHGDFETEEIDLTVETHKADWFVELCEHYSLPSYGTKPVQWDCLVKFSQAGMANLFTPTRISHKGIRNGGVTKRKLPKRVHCILQAGLLTTTTLPVIFATERSKDTHSQIIVDRILPWSQARTLLEKIALEMAATNLRHTHLPEQKASGTYVGVQQMDPFENPSFAQRVTSIIEECLAVYRGSSIDAVIEPLPPSFSESPYPSMDLDTACLGLTTASTDIFPSDAVSAFVPEVSERASVISFNDAPGRALQCTLTFADGTKMTVYKHEVPPTQPFCYTTDLQHLIQSWDDGSADWALPPDHPIIIHGRPIPIKLWGELYRFNKMANTSGTPEAFWAIFSDSQGQHLKFSHVMRILKEKHQQEDDNVAKEAKRVFDKEFINQFGYKKEGRWVRMTRHSDIAKTYRKKIRVEVEST